MSTSDDTSRRVALSTLLFGSTPFYAGLACFCVGAGQYIYFLLTGQCLLDKMGSPDPYASPTHAGQTAITVGCLLGVPGAIAAMYGFLKSQRLAKHGVVVAGTIHTVSSMAVRGMRDISYSYTFNGEVFENRSSVPASHELTPLMEIRLLVDAQRPRTHIVM